VNLQHLDEVLNVLEFVEFGLLISCRAMFSLDRDVLCARCASVASQSPNVRAQKDPPAVQRDSVAGRGRDCASSADDGGKADRWVSSE
jgi:hypothetical protein